MEQYFSLYLLPLFPNTTRQREEGTATVEFDQRVVVMLEWLVLGFGGVPSEFELVRCRYDDECMHDAKC
jgi:hypothetical protein